MGVVGEWQGRRWSTVLVAAVVAIGAAGCTGGGDPAPAPSVTVVSESPTPTPTPTPTGPQPPVKPAALGRTDGSGAAAAAQYYTSLYAYMMQTGDSAEWDAMSNEICKFCSSTSADAADLRARSGRSEGGRIELTGVTVGQMDDLVGGYPVDATFAQEAETRWASDGTVLRRSDAASGHVAIDTINRGSGWEILAVVVTD